MTINDLNGKTIIVDNLDLAIMQADDYRHYRHVNPAHAERDEQLAAYWQHFYEALLRSREQQTE